MKQQDLAEKIAQQTAKKTAQAEAAAKKKIAKLEDAAKKKTAAAERKEAKQAAAAAKRAAKAAAKVSNAEKKAAAQVAKANKKANAQAEKAARLAAKKRAKENPEEAEGGEAAGKKGGKKKLLLLLPIVAIAVGVGVFFFLRSRGGEAEKDPVEPIAPPVEYLFGETNKIFALPVSGGDVVVYETQIPLASAEPEEDAGAEAPAEGEEAPAEGEEDAKAEEEEPPTATQYTYEGLQDPKALLTAYAALLTAADVGFSPVDEDLYRTEMPDFESEEDPASAVYLARNAEVTEGEETTEQVQALRLNWNGEGCTVVVETPEGRVRDPQPESGGMMPMSPGLTVEGFHELSPETLGLPGESMDDYSVYVQDGTIMVYGNTCIRIGVYAEDAATGGNIMAGNYFLSADGQHLYRYDVVNNSVEELDFEK